MILLLGGTSETAPLGEALASAGFKVLVSTATDVPLDVGDHPNLVHRRGKLDETAMAKLIEETGVQIVVDASHPYATSLHLNARAVASRLRIPYLTFVRPTAIRHEDFIHFAEDHEDSARKACAFGRAVLLTTGSRNLDPYVSEARRTGVRLVARVLGHPDSLAACRDAGIAPGDVITGRGPFSVADNRDAIERFDIGCLVTKDSGDAGGVREKIDAARQEGCHVVVVKRPEIRDEASFSTLEDLIQAVTEHMHGNTSQG